MRVSGFLSQAQATARIQGTTLQDVTVHVGTGLRRGDFREVGPIHKTVVARSSSDWMSPKPRC